MQRQRRRRARLWLSPRRRRSTSTPAARRCGRPASDCSIPAIRSLPPGYSQTVDGLQGNATRWCMPQNAPPVNTWFVDYRRYPREPRLPRLRIGARDDLQPLFGRGAPYGRRRRRSPARLARLRKRAMRRHRYLSARHGVQERRPASIQTCPPGYVLTRAMRPAAGVLPAGLRLLQRPMRAARLPAGHAAHAERPVHLPGRQPLLQRQMRAAELLPAGHGAIAQRHLLVPGRERQFNSTAMPAELLSQRLRHHQRPVRAGLVPARLSYGAERAPASRSSGHAVLGEILVNGQCVPKLCPPGQQLRPDGSCHWIADLLAPARSSSTASACRRNARRSSSSAMTATATTSSIDCPKGYGLSERQVRAEAAAVQEQRARCVNGKMRCPTSRTATTTSSMLTASAFPSRRTARTMSSWSTASACRSRRNATPINSWSTASACQAASVKNDEQFVNGSCVAEARAELQERRATRQRQVRAEAA